MNLLVTDGGCYKVEVQNSNTQPQDPELCKIKMRRQCWCPDCHRVYLIIKQPTFVEYPIVDHTKHMDAVALHKKDALFCCCISYGITAQKILLYSLDAHNEMHLLGKLKIALKEDKNYFKKMAFITNTTLLGLTTHGELYSLALQEDKAITMHAQYIDSKNVPMKVEDFAIDPYLTIQMVMTLANNKLVFGDLTKRTYTPLLYGIKNVDLLKFYKDTVAFRENGTEQLNIFNLLLIKHYMFSTLLADSISEKK